MSRPKPERLPVRCYDNGGPDEQDGTIDRYTVVFTKPLYSHGVRYFLYVGMNAAPFHPQGFGQHGESLALPIDRPRSSHLGTRIPFKKLPPDCQKLVRSDLAQMKGTK